MTLNILSVFLLPAKKVLSVDSACHHVMERDYCRFYKSLSSFYRSENVRRLKQNVLYHLSNSYIIYSN